MSTSAAAVLLAAAVVVVAGDSAGASAPAAPPGCTGTTSTFANTTPVVIPTTVAVVTSTIVVSGAGSHLSDVDVTTGLKHTFSADLDVTVTSPAGTVVTLTTDNGSSFDNVFDGTVWDDDANPAGQVPYAVNPELVTDRTYVDLVPAPTLTPEEPLGAFVGENPNGTWTLTVSDDAGGDGGTLTGWSLGFSSLAAAPVTTSRATQTNGTAVPVPSGPAVVTPTIAVSAADPYLSDVDVTTGLQHTFSGDLDVTVTSPAGTVVTLTTDNGGSNDNVFNGTVWDDDANPAGQVPYTVNPEMVTERTYADLVAAPTLTPEEPLAAFIGENANGTWTLTVSDDAAGDGGALLSWSLGLDTSVCPPPVVLDRAVTGAVATPARKAKVKRTGLAVPSTLAATAEALAARTSGVVLVKPKGGGTKKVRLTTASTALPAGRASTVVLSIQGSKRKVRSQRALIARVLGKGGKATARLTYSFSDAAGNTLVLNGSVKLT